MVASRRCASWSSRTSLGSSRSSHAGSRRRVSPWTERATAATGLERALASTLRPRHARSAAARARRSQCPARAAHDATRAPGRDRVRALRPADEAARLRARRRRLPAQAVRARRAGRAASRPAAASATGATTATWSARGHAHARPRPAPGAHRRARAPTCPIASSALLHHLVEHAGRGRSAASACSRRSGATTSIPGSNVVDVCIRRLRKKLGADAPIETVRHAGYRLTAA